MTQKNKLLHNTKIVLDIIYGAFVIICILLALWILLSPLIMNLTGIMITASVPVSIGSGDEPQFDVLLDGSTALEIQNSFVNEAQGILRLETTNMYFIFISHFAKLLTGIGLAYLIYLLRAILEAFTQGDIFTTDNIDRLRRLGCTVLLLGFLRPLVEYIAANEILNQLAIREPALSLPTPFKAEVILASLLILIIAQVWKNGLELKRDLELTV